MDDFESYNDDNNRIYDTWIDGLTNGNSGSTVGYVHAPFAEQTIVHGGKQSMPLDYNNTKSPYYSEAERTWDTPQDWTANGADTLTLWFRGRPVGFVESAAGTLTMGGIGTDIYNTADQFRFAAKKLTGNGTIVAKVESVDNTDPWAKAGVMIRDSLDPDARFAAVYATPGNGVRYQARLLNAGAATSDTTVATPEQMALKTPVWIKIERVGTSFNGYYSTDGVKWTSMSWNPQTIAMTSTVYIGLCVTSHTAAAATTAQFSGVATDRQRRRLLGRGGHRRGPARQRSGPAVRDGAGQRRQEQDDQLSRTRRPRIWPPGSSGALRLSELQLGRGQDVRREEAHPWCRRPIQSETGRRRPRLPRRYHRWPSGGHEPVGPVLRGTRRRLSREKRSCVAPTVYSLLRYPSCERQDDHVWKTDFLRSWRDEEAVPESSAGGVPAGRVLSADGAVRRLCRGRLRAEVQRNE